VSTRPYVLPELRVADQDLAYFLGHAKTLSSVDMSASVKAGFKGHKNRVLLAASNVMGRLHCVLPHVMLQEFDETSKRSHTSSSVQTFKVATEIFLDSSCPTLLPSHVMIRVVQYDKGRGLNGGIRKRWNDANVGRHSKSPL
jgi:hypothetical protein